MTTSISPEQQALLTRIAEAEQQLGSLTQELCGVSSQVDVLAGEQQQYQLLDGICSSLDKLSELGQAALFWEDDSDAETRVARVRARVDDFNKELGAREEARASLQQRVEEQEDQLAFLNEDLGYLQERERNAQFDFVVDREARELPYRPMVMPWSKQGEDEKRFRKSLLIALLFMISLGTIVNLWVLPVPDKNAVIEIPEHLVKMVEKKKKKKPVEKRPEEKPKEKDEKKPDEKKAPTKKETQVARKKAESSGVLAFKNDFNDLLADDTDEKLGASARLSNTGAKSSNNSNRDLVMSQAQSTSGGINTASLNRNVGGGAGKKLGGVGFQRVDSAIGVDMADDRPLSDGPGPSRTDEEIQIVFDRYKAALYRIYNRQLRQDPTLRGKIVLRLTIQPDGSVSLVKVESTDMKSPELSAKILDRVRKFNFGPKEGVPAVTILYPIDFLPAS